MRRAIIRSVEVRQRHFREDHSKVHPKFRTTLARWTVACVLGGLAGFAASSAFAQEPYDGHVQCATEGDPKSCQIDLWLTRGYRAFSQCQVCHGLDGSGSTIGPSLLQKLDGDVNRERFMDVVANGTQGQIGVMPPWKENPNVMKYVDQLYAYLKARADGVLPAGKLKRYDR